MLFSILIPVYNTEKYLADCLDSVLSQDEQDYEIILCDDCSTDGSLRVCEEFAKRCDKIKVLRNDFNMGLLSTRRKLFAAASGDYVLCADSDDTLAGNALTKLKSAIEATNADMIMFDLQCLYLDGSEKAFCPKLEAGRIYSGSEKALCLGAVYYNNYMNSLCTKLFRRELIDLDCDYGPYSELTIGEDLFQSYPLWDRAESIYYLHECLYIYHKRETSMTNGYNRRLYEMRRMLWTRDDFYRSRWNLDAGDIRAGNTGRVNDIINHISKIARESGKESFYRELDLILYDGFLRRASANCDIKGRYRFYTDLVLRKSRFALYCMLKIEHAVLSVAPGK